MSASESHHTGRTDFWVGRDRVAGVKVEANLRRLSDRDLRGARFVFQCWRHDMARTAAERELTGALIGLMTALIDGADTAPAVADYDALDELLRNAPAAEVGVLTALREVVNSIDLNNPRSADR